MAQSDSSKRGLLTGFVIIIVFMMLIAIVGLNRMFIISDDIDHIVLSHNVKFELVKQMRTSARERSILLHSMAVADDPFKRDELFMAMRGQGELFLKARGNLFKTELDNREQSLLAKQFELSAVAGTLQYQVIDLLAAHKRHEAIQVLVEQAIPVQDQVLSILDQFTNLQIENNNKNFEDVTRQFNNAYIMLIPMGIITIILSILIAFITIRKITSTLNDNAMINRHLQNAVTMLKQELAGRKRMQAKLRTSEKREKTIREHILDAIITINDRGIIKSINPAAETMFGYSTKEMLGHSVNMLMPEPHSSKHNSYLATYLRSGVANIIGKGREVLCLRKDGATFPADLGVTEFDVNGKRHFIGSIHDISELKATQEELQQSQVELEKRVEERTHELKLANEQLAQLAHYDSLTALPNRAMYFIQLEKAMAHAHRNQSRIAILFIDVDGFKQVNDEFGHDAGDKLLQDLAIRLKTCVRSEDLVARLGGDEFIIALVNLTDIASVHAISDKLIGKLNEQYLLDNGIAHVSVSIGISVYPDDSETMDILLKYADQAMYDVKRKGKNAYQFYHQPATNLELPVFGKKNADRG